VAKAAQQEIITYCIEQACSIIKKQNKHGNHFTKLA